MSQPWQQSDYTIIASPSLGQQAITRNGRTIEVVSLKFPEAEADSVAHNSADIYDLYTRLFRHSPTVAACASSSSRQMAKVPLVAETSSYVAADTTTSGSTSYLPTR